MNIKTTVRRDKIDAERWGRLKDILADALEQPSTEARAKYVARRCADDASLLAEAAALLREADRLIEAPTDTLEECAEHATAKLWQDETSREGSRIGAYSVKRELGRGGMGTVYLAARADGQFEKEVAIKVLKRGMDTDEVLRRFTAERHILARLDHPNIARLIDAGTTDEGLPYFVMEYVAGAPVTRFVREHGLSVSERLRLFLKICAAVEVAHRQHVIHRDLKPTNIFVNNEGEPKLLDFGIAKLLTPGDDWVDLTTAGEQRLTPACASPEQADGRPMTEASDVYALGALLYEMLTGEKPHKFESTRPSNEEIARVIREQEPGRPSSVCAPDDARQLRGDLDAIVMFALRKQPDCRYPQVGDLAADINRHLSHEPVQAMRDSVRYRARCLVARHRPRRGAVVLAASLLILGLGLAWWSRTTVQPVNSSTDRPKSIAVLPFDNIGDNTASSYFSDGVQDNILTDLGKIGDLKVISRSGVALFRAKSRDIKEIGRQLGVSNVLEGSVQIVGDRVRINAQLIDTASNTQVWADQFDRRLEDIFAVQSELAQTIAAQLNARLSSGEKAAIWKRPTEDMQAYDLYLRARAKMNWSPGSEPPKNWAAAIELLNAAVARDPKFTLAYCLLNDAHLLEYRYGEDHSPERLVAAKQATDAALNLDPQLEDVRLASARYYYRGLTDYRRTQEELSKIPAAGAHQIDYFTIAGLVQRRVGRWDEAIRNGEKAVELDPQDSRLAFNLVQTLTGVRRFNASEKAANAAIMRLPATATDGLWILKSELGMARGDLDAAQAAIDSVHSKMGMDYEIARLWLAFLRRDYAAVQKFGSAAEPRTKSTPTMWVVLGIAARARGDREAAQQAFREAARVANAALVQRVDDPELLSELGIAEAGLGDYESALHHARRAGELVPVSMDALTGPVIASNVVLVLAWTGDMEGAVDLLSKLARIPFGPSYGDLQYSAYWDDLRSDSRFVQIVEDAAALGALSDRVPSSQ